MAIRNSFEHAFKLAENMDNLQVEDVKRELADNPDVLLVDIRELQEVIDKGTIPGSKHAP